MDYILRREEQTVLRLRSLYAMHGYRPYKMGKFEEYDFYAENKRFLESGNIVTFTDTNGRLMALKPDVTLSIARGAAARRDTLKVYYDENVYRAPDADAGFQEITQTGIECIGSLDDYAMGEVLYLAAESLRAISPSFVLDVSDMGFVSALLPELKLDGERASQSLKALSSRNLPELGSILASSGAPEDLSAAFLSLAGDYGALSTLLPKLRSFVVNTGMSASVERLENLARVLNGFGCLDSVNLDLTITGDMDYYNSLVFKGYIEGVPSAVLSGGRYDALMRKLGRSAGAVGFAVYLNVLECLDDGSGEETCDVTLLYSDEPAEEIAREVRALAANGKSVLVRRRDEDAREEAGNNA